MPKLASPQPVIATTSVKALLKKLQEEHGPLVLYQPKGSAGRIGLVCFPVRRTKPFCHSGICREAAPYIEVRPVN